MESLPIIQSKAISEIRSPVESGLQMPQAWAKLASATASLADDFQKDAAAAQGKRIAEMETNIERQAIDMRDKYDNDPQGFDKEWTEFSAQLIGNTEADLHDDLLIRLKKEGNQQYSNILSRRRDLDRQFAADSLSDRQEIVTNRILSMSGNSSTLPEELQAEYTELENLLNAQANMGLKGRDSVQRDLDMVAIQAKQESILKTAREAYDSGDIQTVADIHDDLLNGDLLSELEPNKRRNLANMIKSDISTNSDLIESEQRRKDAEAERVLKKEMLSAQREYVELVAQGKMTQEWIQENKSRLSNTLYAKAVNDYGMPSAAPISSDKLALDDIEALTDEDLDAVIPTATQHYAAGRLSIDDLKNTIETVDAKSQKPVDEKERSRVRIRESLKTPSYLKSFAKDDPAKASDAVRQLDDWIAKNPDASDSDIEKRSSEIINKYKVDALTVLPSPYGTASPKGKITEVTIGQGYQKIKDAYQSGKLSKDEARKEAEALKAWTEYLKGKTDGQ